MNRKQTFLVFVIFFFMLAVITIPMWIETALPILRDYLNSGRDTIENWYVFLKVIFMRLLDRHVLNFTLFIFSAY